MTDSQQNFTFSNSVDKLRGEFDSLIEKAMTQGEKALNVFGVKENFFSWCPAVEMTENTEEIHVIVEVPGIKANDLDVSLAGNMLTIEGSREFPETPKGEISHLNERKEGTFKRVLPMPSAVNPDEVNADVTNGILHLTIGKSEACKPRQIVIQSNSETAKKEESLQGSPE